MSYKGSFLCVPVSLSDLYASYCIDRPRTVQFVPSSAQNIDTIPIESARSIRGTEADPYQKARAGKRRLRFLGATGMQLAPCMSCGMSCAARRDREVEDDDIIPSKGARRRRAMRTSTFCKSCKQEKGYRAEWEMRKDEWQKVRPTLIPH